MLIVLNLSGQLCNPLEVAVLLIALYIGLNLVQNWDLVLAHFDTVELVLMNLVVPGVALQIFNFETPGRVRHQEVPNDFFAGLVYVARHDVVRFKDLLVELVSVWVFEGKVPHSHRVRYNAQTPQVGVQAQVPLPSDHFW